MRPGRTSGRTTKPHYISCPNPVSDGDLTFGQMPIEGLQPVLMPENHKIAIPGNIARHTYSAVESRSHRCPRLQRDISSLVTTSASVSELGIYFPHIRAHKTAYRIYKANTVAITDIIEGHLGVRIRHIHDPIIPKHVILLKFLPILDITPCIVVIQNNLQVTVTYIQRIDRRTFPFLEQARHGNEIFRHPCGGGRRHISLQSRSICN